MRLSKQLLLRYVVFFVVGILFLYIYAGNLGKVEVGIEQVSGNEILGEILQGTEIRQEFYSNGNNLSGFSIKFATYMRKNEGHIQIGIREHRSSREIYSSKINLASLQDNAFYDFRHPPIKHSKNKMYYIYIKSFDGTVGNSFTLYKTRNDEYELGKLWLNGKNIDGDLNFKVYYNKTLL